MAVDGTPYLEALVAARDRGRVITRQTHDRIMQSMFRSLRDLTASEGAGAITPERAEALRRQFASLMESFEDGFALATERGIDLTIDDISSLHDRALSRMSEAAGVPIRSSFEGIDDLVYSNLAIRRGSDSFVSLMDYRLNGAMREFDTMLTAAVSRGVPSGQITMDLAQVMASNDPALQQALSRLPRGFRAARVGGLASVDFSRYGIDEKDVQGLRTLLYDARRIGVSETNNALREANGIAMQSSPVVEAARWQTSGRHDGLPSSPDACDIYEQQDLYGLGVGMYPPEFWPFGPHSHCGCYQGGPMRFRNPSEWNKPRPAPPPRRIDPTEGEAFKRLTQGMPPGKTRQMLRQVSTNTRLTELKKTAQVARSVATSAPVRQAAPSKPWRPDLIRDILLTKIGGVVKRGQKVTRRNYAGDVMSERRGDLSAATLRKRAEKLREEMAADLGTRADEVVMAYDDLEWEQIVRDNYPSGLAKGLPTAFAARGKVFLSPTIVESMVDSVNGSKVWRVAVHELMHEASGYRKDTMSGLTKTLEEGANEVLSTAWMRRRFSDSDDWYAFTYKTIDGDYARIGGADSLIPGVAYKDDVLNTILAAGEKVGWDDPNAILREIERIFRAEGDVSALSDASRAIYTTLDDQAAAATSRLRDRWFLEEADLGWQPWANKTEKYQRALENMRAAGIDLEAFPMENWQDTFSDLTEEKARREQITHSLLKWLHGA